MSRAVDLGIPEQALPAWHALMDGLATAGTTPCAGAGRDRWLGTEKHQRTAADACMDCPVLRACDTYATAARERHGVWGGFTERERAAREGRKR